MIAAGVTEAYCSHFPNTLLTSTHLKNRLYKGKQWPLPGMSSKRLIWLGVQGTPHRSYSYIYSHEWLYASHPLDTYCRGSLHTSQISHLLLYPSLWLLVPGLSSHFVIVSFTTFFKANTGQQYPQKMATGFLMPWEPLLLSLCTFPKFTDACVTDTGMPKHTTRSEKYQVGTN